MHFSIGGSTQSTYIQTTDMVIYIYVLEYDCLALHFYLTTHHPQSTCFPVSCWLGKKNYKNTDTTQRYHWHNTMLLVTHNISLLLTQNNVTTVKTQHSVTTVKTQHYYYFI